MYKLSILALALAQVLRLDGCMSCQRYTAMSRMTASLDTRAGPRSTPTWLKQKVHEPNDDACGRKKHIISAPHPTPNLRLLFCRLTSWPMAKYSAGKNVWMWSNPEGWKLSVRLPPSFKPIIRYSTSSELGSSSSVMRQLHRQHRNRHGRETWEREQGPWGKTAIHGKARFPQSCAPKFQSQLR